MEVWQIAWDRARRAQRQHFLHVFCRVFWDVLQLQLQTQHLLQHLRQLQPQLGNAPTMTQVLEIAAMNAAAARTQVVGLASCVKDRQQVTTVHLTVQAQMKTWPSHAWIGLLAAMQ